MREEGTLWNFAYGGNMNPRVLCDRRGIVPLESVPGCLKDHRLAFNLPGFPWFEPVFSNVEPAKGESVHGVLHRLTEKQFARLDRFEGAGLAYRHAELEVQAYDGRSVRARIFAARVTTRDKSPSCRYMNILREGARHHGLAPEYMAMLEALPCHERWAMPEGPFKLFESLFRITTRLIGRWPGRGDPS